MDFKDLAAQLVKGKIGSARDSGDVRAALDELVPGNDEFDIGGIVGRFQNSGGDLAGKVSSWLGDGANESISPSQLQDVIGFDKIESFARKLGIGTEEANSMLSEILPQLIDKSSSGGNLLDSVGGVEGLGGLASKFFR